MKRAFDIILAITGIILFAPFFLIIPPFILAADGPPVFYVKRSLGKKGKVINLIKFRSMGRASEITRTGGFLRRTAMDELPQLINIIRGDMSFVGPRPYGIGKYEELRDAGFFGRLEAIPGLTGLAQVYAPKHASNEDILKLDLEYIKRRSFLLDIKLIAVSVYITLKGAWEKTTKRL